MTALIQIENLHYRPEAYDQDLPGILNGIDLDIKQGSFTVIVGENGSGKTTLIKQINGLLLPTRGSVIVDGLDTRLTNQHARLRTLVGMVFQDPADQIVASTVEEDVAFGLENINLPTAEIRSRVAEQLSAAGLLDEATRPPHLLSGGQIQMVALAGVLARRPRVILFDEPTSMLDPQARQSFLQRLHQLRREGLTIVYVTHHMEEAVDADQIVVMHAGRIALEGTPQFVFQRSNNLYEYSVEVPEAVRFSEQFQALGLAIDAPILTPQALLNALPLYTGTQDQNKFSSDKRRQPPPPDGLISFENVHYTYLSGTPLARQALKGVNLTISATRIHALAGANGSGKSTLLQHINGILRPEKGTAHVGQFILEDPSTSLWDVIRMAGLVFQNPENQFFEVLVGDEIAYGPRQFGMGDLRDRVRTAMEMVGLDFDLFKDRRLDSLSGGEKRKVALASTLVLDQDILMLDEPTAGMDPRSRDETLHLLKKLQGQGRTIIIASHRMEEMAQVADHLSLMHSGQVLHTGSVGALMANPAWLAKAGLMAPLAVEIAQTLFENGWPICAEKTYTIQRLVSTLKDLVP